MVCPLSACSTCWTSGAWTVATDCMQVDATLSLAQLLASASPGCMTLQVNATEDSGIPACRSSGAWVSVCRSGIERLVHDGQLGAEELRKKAQEAVRHRLSTDTDTPKELVRHSSCVLAYPQPCSADCLHICGYYVLTLLQTSLHSCCVMLVHIHGKYGSAAVQSDCMNTHHTCPLASVQVCQQHCHKGTSLSRAASGYRGSCDDV